MKYTVFVLALLIAGCNDKPSSHPVTSNLPSRQPAQHIPKPAILPIDATIPQDVEFFIAQEQTVPGIKRSLDIRINKKVSEDVLRAIAMKLKSGSHKTYDRTFIGYYLPGMKVDEGYWATTHFNPNLEIRVLGLTLDEEKNIIPEPAIASRRTVGRWLQDEEPFPGVITFYHEGDAFYMEKTFRDGGKRIHPMIEKSSQNGKKYMDGKRSGSDDDYYLIDNHGDLQIWSQDTDGAHVLVVTAKKIK